VAPVVLGASIVAFTIMHVAPGSPGNREGRQLEPEVVARLNEALGLDQPLPLQYLAWLGRLLQGDLGIGTTTTRYDVADIIFPAIGTSLVLCGLAFALALAVGLPLGLVAALRHRTPLGWAATGVALLGMALPAFALAAFLQLVLVPSHFSGVTGLPRPAEWATSVEWILPTIALAGLPMAQIARHTKASVLEVLHADYVRTAYAKGLRDDQVIRFHLLRNAAIPVVTIAGSVLAVLVTGSIVVERVFEIPGLGNLYFWAIRGRDYALLMSITVVYALVVALANAVVDVAYGVIDPRIRDGSVAQPEETNRG
jgi:oligopeptide transport system permease protein